ncbi:unnamed protein product [Paramecium octaurelia]|uniref:G domain-containing protein n=1 Tax=Paramecium octaurelia TaxID=43137 RepID=A0A8S1WGB1_PAROT|nr:unnamed protein product [Paramecium octaurelia]
MESQLSNEVQLQIETEILKIVDKCQGLFSTFNNTAEKKIEIVLFVGKTGAGKSTLFNFLSGAEFKIQERELELRNPSNKFSEMKGGMNSVSKEPNYYFNSEYNHLLIDFPGFQDTNGQFDQLLIELIFQKVVTQLPIKVVYVIKNNESTLPDRGIDIIEFIDKLFKKSNLDINKFNLLLNCYLENLSDFELKRKIRRELTNANKNNYIDNILIMRKVQNAEDLKNVFTTQKRNEQWKALQQIKPVQLKPQSIPKFAIISQYLIQQISMIADEYNRIIYDNVEKLCEQMNNSIKSEQIRQTQSIIQVITKAEVKDASEWYTTFIENCGKIPNINQIERNLNNFKKIFHFCSQFQNQIENYSEVIFSIKNTQKKFQKLQENIDQIIKNQQEKTQRESQIANLSSQKEELKKEVGIQGQQTQKLQLQINRQKQDSIRLQNQSRNQQYQHMELQKKVKRQEDHYYYLQNELREIEVRNKIRDFVNFLMLMDTIFDF